MIIDHKVYKHIISIPADTDSDNIRKGNLEAFSLQYSITPSLSISHELCGFNDDFQDPIIHSSNIIEEFLFSGLTFYKTENQYPHIQPTVSEATFAQKFFMTGCMQRLVPEASHMILRVLF